ncbi:glutamate--tRNA ligase [Candidatus Dependentiae bacterium]|nr:glutamate--tRNA ligase [Candidatus Dependentiae bacterium]
MTTPSTRTRFAPSPTGLMHLGNVRAALVNYLFAHQHRGVFILRIEDTDAQRNFDLGGKQIIEDLVWLGLIYDEGPGKDRGCGPYYQSERMPLYQEKLAVLIKENKVYRCFCTEQELERSRQRQIALKKPPRYDRTCLALSADACAAELQAETPFIWRMKLDDSLSFEIHDLARGLVRFELKNFSDFPLTRQDDSVTFLFANAIDDMTMKISHVFRGEDHLSNTALQAALYHAFATPLPTYWHMPILCNSEGKKLSKRDFGFSLNDLRAAGFLPEAICNYLAIIGGGTFEQEILSLDQLVSVVRFDNISAAGQVRYDVEKLRWLNHKWIEKLDPHELTNLSMPFLTAAYPAVAMMDQAMITHLLQTIKTDIVTLADAVQALHFYFNAPTLSLGDITHHFDHQLPAIQACVMEHIESITAVDSFLQAVKLSAKEKGIGMKPLFWFLRFALMGQQDGPSIHDLITMLSAEESYKRIKRLAE